MFRLRITGDLGFEAWEDIPGYEGLYQASTYGRIKRLAGVFYCGHRCKQKREIKEQIMTPCKNKKGYFQLRLSRGDGKRSGGLVHRYVAFTFLPNPYNYPQINHKDECKTNNRIDNLEWCDNDYNIHYGTAIERARIKNCKVVNIFKGNLLIKTCLGTKEASEFIGCDKSVIIRCALGDNKYRNNEVKGFKVEYA